MLALKYFVLAAAVVALLIAAALVLFDVYLLTAYRRRLALAPGEHLPLPRPVRWRPSVQLAVASVLALLVASSFAVVPAGHAGVRISQLSGTQPTTLYPGVHFTVPLLQTIALYDVRDQLYTTSADVAPRKSAKPADETPH